MLFQRILTALVLAPSMLAGIYLLPDIGFRVFIGVIVAIAAWEWANLAGIKTQATRLYFVLFILLVLGGLHWQLDANRAVWGYVVLATIVWWVVATYVVMNYPNKAGWLASRTLKAIVALPVLVGFWMGLVWLKLQDQSVLLLTWLMLLVWGADIGAYFSGRAFGDRKLAAKVSPGKTWAGVYGGMATSVLISVVIAYLYLPNNSAKAWLWLIVMSVVIVAVSVLGDLFESLLKRNRGIKDSSSLLPGHGGVLDRADSLCAATPFFVLFWLVLSFI